MSEAATATQKVKETPQTVCDIDHLEFSYVGGGLVMLTAYNTDDEQIDWLMTEEVFENAIRLYTSERQTIEKSLNDPAEVVG